MMAWMMRVFAACLGPSSKRLWKCISQMQLFFSVERIHYLVIGWGASTLSVKGHAVCRRYLQSFNVPLMVFGGGGYTIRNVARCWCYEIAVAVGVDPYNKYYE